MKTHMKTRKKFFFIALTVAGRLDGPKMRAHGSIVCWKQLMRCD